MTIDCLLINEESSVFLRNQHVTQNRLSLAGSQTLLASENEFSSTGNCNSTETVGDACRLRLAGNGIKSMWVISKTEMLNYQSKTN